MSKSDRLIYSAARASALALTALAAACGGGGGGSSTTTGGGGGTTPTTFTVSGNVSGLSSGASVVLLDNGGDNKTVSANGSFSFATAIASGGAYAVTVGTEPTGETCAVAGGSGTATANVTTVAITCTTNPPNSFTIGGNVSGLASGVSVVLQDNGGDNKTVSANGAFTFTTPVVTGNAYAVSILTPPTGQSCSVAQGSGTVNGANVTNVAVTCTSGFTVGGTVSGLLSGETLVLQDNGGDNNTITANGTFTFATGVMTGQNYAVTVLTQPGTPAELCRITGGSGTIATAAVTNVTVFCGKIGQVVAVTDKLDGTISTYTINPTTGALTPNAANPVAVPVADNRPTSAVIDNGGQNLYVGEYGSLQVSQYTLDPTTGNITFHRDTASTQTQPSSVALTPSNGFLYAAGGLNTAGEVYAFGVNSASGDLSQLSNQSIGGLNSPVTSIAIDPTGTLMFAATPSHWVTVLTIGSDGTLAQTAQDPVTIGSGGTPANAPYGTAIWPRGTASGGFLYVTTETAANVWSFSYAANGTLTPTAGVFANNGTTQDTRGMAIDPTGTYLYVANHASGTVSAWSINQTTGDLTLVGPDVATKSGITPPTATVGPSSLVWDPSGQWLYCTNDVDGSVSVFTAVNGTLTLQGNYPAGAGGQSTNKLALAVY